MSILLKRALCFALASWVTCSSCAAQPVPTGNEDHAAVVNAIGVELAPLAQTDEVSVLKFADFAEQRGLQQGQTLFEGDMLYGGRDGLLIELRCNGGSLIKLSGTFRIAINARRDNQDCALNLFAGVVDVVTDRPTEVNAGGRIMGSAGTRYAVDARAEDGSQLINLTVFEGAVTVRGVGEARRIEQMTTVALRDVSADFAPTTIPDARLRQQARLLAKFDVVKASAALGENGLQWDTAAAAESLAGLNEAVLRAPEDVDVRLQLATAQLGLDLTEEAEYNLSRPNVELRALQSSEEVALRRRLLDSPATSDERIRLLFREQPDLKRQAEYFRELQQFPRDGGG